VVVDKFILTLKRYYEVEVNTKSYVRSDTPMDVSGTMGVFRIKPVLAIEIIICLTIETIL